MNKLWKLHDHYKYLQIKITDYLQTLLNFQTLFGSARGWKR